MQTEIEDGIKANVLAYARYVLARLQHHYGESLTRDDLLEMLEAAVPEVLPEWKQNFGSNVNAEFALMEAKEKFPSVVSHLLAARYLVGVDAIHFRMNFEVDSAGEFRPLQRPSTPASPVLLVVSQQLPPAPVAKPGRQRSNSSTINQRMAALIQTEHNCVSWSARKWAEKFDCSPAAIKQTYTWKCTIKKARALLQAEKLN